MNGKRIVWLDSCKGFLILLVIFGHSTHAGLFHINNALSSIAMPGFMACSGWLASKAGVDKVIRRFRQLIIPFILWSLIAFCLNGLNIKTIGHIFLKPDSYNMWFLWALFWIFCLFSFCLWISEKIKMNKVISIITMACLLMVVMVVFNFRLFGFQFISYYFLFYSFGYFYHQYDKIQINNNYIICLLFVIWAFLAYFWQLHELPYWIPTNTIIPASILQYLYRGVTGVIGVFVIFALFSKYLNHKTKINNILLDVGGISLGLYVVHLVIQKYIHGLISSFYSNIDILFIICEFIILFTLSYVIVKLLRKNKYTNEYLLGKF